MMDPRGMDCCWAVFEPLEVVVLSGGTREPIALRVKYSGRFRRR